MQTTSPNHFAAVVRAKLLDNKLEGRKPDSIRGLARALGNGDATRGETFKRSLFKWMASGEPNPSRESRAIVARALGLDPSALADPDEEDDPAMREAFHLFVDLMAQIDTARQKKNARKRAERFAVSPTSSAVSPGTTERRAP